MREERMLIVNEVSEGLQNSGALIGRPMTFITLGGAQGDVAMDTRDIIKLVKGFGNTEVYIKGQSLRDEPLSRSKEDLEDLVELLYATRFSPIIETGGMLAPGSTLRDLVSGWEICPDLSLIKPDHLDMLVKYLHTRMQFRFIIMSEGDVAYVRDLLEYVGDYPITLLAAGDYTTEHLYLDTRQMFKGYNVRYLNG
jgi:hypothetical protein